MISYLGEWIQSIVLLILIATFLDLLLPGGNMRRYIRMVIGLMIMLVILSPLLDLFQVDQERMLGTLDDVLEQDTPVLEEEVEQTRQHVEAFQHEAVLREVGEEMGEELIHEIEATHAVQVDDVHMDLASDVEQLHVNELHLAVSDVREGEEEQGSQVGNQEGTYADQEKREADDTVSEAGGVQVDIESIEPVNIGREEKDASDVEKLSAKESEIQDKVLTYLEKEWNISVDKISIKWTKR